MEDFADVAMARASYKSFQSALLAGRDILRRAGVPEPPPVPEFDDVFPHLNADARRQLYENLRAEPNMAAVDAIRLWTPLVKLALSGE